MGKLIKNGVRRPQNLSPETKERKSSVGNDTLKEREEKGGKFAIDQH